MPYEVTRCLSVRRPWAPLITLGYKGVENRSWHTAYRGRIAIHASNGDELAAYQRWLYEGDAADDTHGPILCDATQLAEFRKYMRGQHGPALNELRVGPGIIGTVEIIDVVDMTASDDAYTRIPNESDGYSLPPWCWYTGGSFAWVLANPVAFIQPIKCDGKLNLWRLDSRLAALVDAAERRALEAVDWTA